MQVHLESSVILWTARCLLKFRNNFCNALVGCALAEMDATTDAYAHDLAMYLLVGYLPDLDLDLDQKHSNLMRPLQSRQALSTLC